MSQWMKYYFYAKNFALAAKDEEGQGMVEYAMILVAVAGVAVAVVAALDTQLTDFINGISFDGS